jgi:hypothetical protein
MYRLDGRTFFTSKKPLLGCRYHRHVSIERLLLYRLLGIWSGTPEMHVLIKKKHEKHREPRFKVYTAAD